jgi:hypothetical protein
MKVIIMKFLLILLVSVVLILILFQGVGFR